MEATDALIQAELSLRNLIRTVLGESWRELPGLPTASELDDRKRGEGNSRQGVVVSQDSMDYLFIGDLKKIFDHRRAAFGDVFTDKPRFNELVRILVTYRNTAFHARSLTWFESDLVTGAAGWIVANITHWRNVQAGREGDYPEILSVTDGTGQAFIVGYVDPTRVPDLGILDVGQTLTLRCQGVDADERPLVWRLHKDFPYRSSQALAEARGSNATLEWTPTKQDVATYVGLYATLSADDDYPRAHSNYDFDAVAMAHFSILRPRTLKPPASVL